MLLQGIHTIIIIIYHTNTIISVSIVAKRSLSLPSGLGQRLSIINTEALGINIDDLYTDQTNQTATNTTTTTSDNILINLARMERESNTEIYESLDQVNYYHYQ